MGCQHRTRGVFGRAFAFEALAFALALCGCSDVIGIPIRRAPDASDSEGSRKDAGSAKRDAAVADAGSDRTRSDLRHDGGVPFFGRDPYGSTSGSTRMFCPATASWTDAQASAEQTLVDAINTARSSGFSCGAQSYRNLASLRVMPQLTCSARMHSMDMGTRGYFSQTDPSGTAPATRMAATGLVFTNSAELIARSTTNHVLSDLMDSNPNACSELASMKFTAIGVGDYEGLWTVDLAGP